MLSQRKQVSWLVDGQFTKIPSAALIHLFSEEVKVVRDDKRYHTRSGAVGQR